MAAVRGSSEPSHARPVGGMGYVVLEVAGQLFGEGERLAARYTLAVLGATDLLKSAANKATVCLLAGSAVSFRCLQNWRKRRRPDLYALEEDDDMAKLCRV